MYICICKAVTDSQLCTAMNNGLCTRQQIAHCLGVGRECGKCNKAVNELLEQHTKQKTVCSPVLSTH